MGHSLRSDSPRRPGDPWLLRERRRCACGTRSGEQVLLTNIVNVGLALSSVPEFVAGVIFLTVLAVPIDFFNK